MTSISTSLPSTFPFKLRAQLCYRCSLVVGLMALLGLVVFVTFTGLSHMASIRDQSHVIVDHHMLKTEAVTRLFNLARERTRLIQSIALQTDPFEQDALWMEANAVAGRFVQVREHLLGLPLNARERLLLAEQARLSAVAMPLQDEVFEMMQAGRIEEARRRLLYETVPAQTRVLDLLETLYDHQLQAARGAASRAGLIYQQAQYRMLWSSGGAMLLGLFIAITVIRRTARATAERERHLGEISAANRKLKEQRDELAEARDRAQQANRAKSAFLANMSHEIRTPLTAINGFAELLHDASQSPADRLAAIDVITDSSRHLMQIINDILDLSKIEAGRMLTESINVSLFGLLNEIDSAMSLQARRKQLDFQVNYHFPLPEEIRTDPTRLKQILFNLCNNAIKFTEQGRVCVEVSMVPATGMLEISVLDTGIGIPADKLESVFRAFTQADSGTTRRYGGTGLGLRIARLLAEQLGGTLTASSEPGRGSRFTLCLPPGPAATRTLLSEKPSRSGRLAGDASPVQLAVPALQGRVLLVEDNPANQKLISLLIRRSGADVVLADNGEQGIATALRQRFDLVLMDMQMPVMDGVVATRELREAGYAGPIIALTANVQQTDTARYLAAGCNAALGKPVDLADFYQLLAQHLQPSDPPLAPATN